jgi:hypothetical protein
MDNAQAEFDAHDMELIAQAQRETEAAEATDKTTEVAKPDEEASAAAPVAAPAPEAAPAAPAAPAAAPEAAPAAPAAAPTPAAPAAAPAAPAAVDAQGNVKAALRASRHTERVLRQEVEALRKQVAEGGTTKAPKDEPVEPDEGQLNDVREYAPAVGKAFDAQKARIAELEKRVASAPVAEPEVAFAPEVFDAETQAAIDEVPELLLWHSSPDHQREFEAAKAADRLLMVAPAWKDKPVADRFAAAVALVKAQGVAPSKASAAKTLADAQARIAAAPPAPVGVLAVGDLRGGAHPANTSGTDPYAMVKAGATDEDIMASLPILP